MKIRISTKSVAVWLTGIVVAVNLIGVVGRAFENLLGYQDTTELVRLFHVGYEGNITSWVSSLLLLISAVLLAAIAIGKRQHGGPYLRHWSVLALIFVYLSVDEAARIHELTMYPIRSAFDPTGVFYYAWVIVAIPLVLLFAVSYLGFLRALPRDTRIQFVIAGLIFVIGAIGMDMLGGLFITSDLERGQSIAVLIQIIEEFLENMGIVVFIVAIVSYLRSSKGMNHIALEIV